MRFEDFSSRGAAVSGLIRSFLSGAPCHASLILGPPGIGKRTLAEICAMSLFCTAEEVKPCGHCPPCKRYLAGHADVHRLMPEKKSIGVDGVRTLIRDLFNAAYEGGMKVALIADAGTMTKPAQNALLKTLEEPPDNTVFLLTAGSISEVLPTIASRCRLVRMPPMSLEAVKAILMEKGMEEGRARTLAALSEGSLGRALHMDGDPAFWALRDKVLGALSAIRTRGDVWPAIGALKEDKKESALILDMMEGAFRGALLSSLMPETPGRLAQAPWSGAKNSKVQARRLSSVATARRMLGSNVPWQAALERLLLEYAEDYHQWQR